MKAMVYIGVLGAVLTTVGCWPPFINPSGPHHPPQGPPLSSGLTPVRLPVSADKIDPDNAHEMANQLSEEMDLEQRDRRERQR